jgi:hypothetical protein
MSRPRSIGLLVLLVLPTLLLAQTPPPKPPAPKLPPIITVTRTDGTQVKGQYVSADGKVLTLRTLTKGKPDENTTEVPWSDIKTTSTGLTRAKAFAAWKEENRNALCGDCAGEGLTTCATCKGTAHDPAALKGCATCKDELLVPCKGPKCDKGRIPCPGPCLKLSVGPWVRKDDGKLWKKVPVKGGYGDISESHLGEVWEKDKDGNYSAKPCPICNKGGFVTCPKCEGKGQFPCPTCFANTKAAACKDCDKGKSKCATCEGTGLKK